MGLTNDMLFVTRKMQNSNDPGHCKKGEQERYFMVYLDVVSLVILPFHILS
jgi:hypothetical protein